MNPDILRRLDRWLGSLFCGVAGCFAQRKPGAPGPIPPPAHILVIKLTEMGSTVLALPALQEMQTIWPAARLHFLVFRNSRAILDALALAPDDRILEIDDRSALRAMFSGFRALYRVRRLRPEIAIDFDFFSYFTALFAFLACRGARVGFDAYGSFKRRSRLLTHRVIYSPVQHTSRAFLALTRTVTHPSAGEPFFRGSLEDQSFKLPDFVPSESDRAEAEQLLRVKGVPSDAKLLLFSTNASALLPLRRWPAERFVEAATRLRQANKSLWILLIGGSDERQEAEALAHEMGNERCTSVAGLTSFGGFLALCARADAMLCNDGGPAHFAGMVKLPTVVLFGPETPVLYRPLSPRTQVLYKPLPCSPCVHVFNAKKSYCPRALCLESIPVDEAVTAVQAQLDTGRNGIPC